MTDEQLFDIYQCGQVEYYEPEWLDQDTDDYEYQQEYLLD